MFFNAICQKYIGIQMVNLGNTITLYTISAEIYHFMPYRYSLFGVESLSLCPKKLSSMTIPNNLKEKYHTVCDAPSGNGFIVEHMPDLFANSTINDCSAHVHSFYEILWFQKGTGRHTVDFTDYQVKPGTIFFLSPGQIHHFDVRERYKGIAIKMCTDLLKSSSPDNLFLQYNSFHTYDSTPYYIIDEPSARELQTLVDEMEMESQRYGEFGNTELLKSLLCIFLVKIQRLGFRETGLRLNNLKPSHQLFIQFRQLVEQEYTRLHTVQEYADRLNVALRTLSKCVGECSQRSPLTFINERIILEAKRMVKYTNMMIKEIAFELGYDDPSYFVKFFKRQTGYLPSDFRELDNVTTSFSSCASPQS